MTIYTTDRMTNGQVWLELGEVKRGDLPQHVRKQLRPPPHHA